MMICNRLSAFMSDGFSALDDPDATEDEEDDPLLLPDDPAHLVPFSGLLPSFLRQVAGCLPPPPAIPGESHRLPRKTMGLSRLLLDFGRPGVFFMDFAQEEQYHT